MRLPHILQSRFNMSLFWARLGARGLKGFRLQLGGWLSVLIVFGLAAVLVANLWRVSANAQYSSDVYEYEKDNLQDLQAENQRLHSQLEYYESPVFQQVFARVAQRLAPGDVRLIEVVEELPARAAKQQQDLLQTEIYTNWWGTLL